MVGPWPRCVPQIGSSLRMALQTPTATAFLADASMNVDRDGALPEPLGYPFIEFMGGRHLVLHFHQ